MKSSTRGARLRAISSGRLRAVGAARARYLVVGLATAGLLAVAGGVALAAPTSTHQAASLVVHRAGASRGPAGVVRVSGRPRDSDDHGPDGAGFAAAAVYPPLPYSPGSGASRPSGGQGGAFPPGGGSISASPSTSTSAPISSGVAPPTTSSASDAPGPTPSSRGPSSAASIGAQSFGLPASFLVTVAVVLVLLGGLAVLLLTRRSG